MDLRTAIISTALLFSPAIHAQTIGEKLDRLVRAYPHDLVGHDDNFLFWRDGTKMPVGKPDERKPFEGLLGQSTILDQLSLPYPRGASPSPAENDDPGRFRNEEFFKKMYGDCTKGQVAPNLVSIAWLPHTWGKTVKVTRVNGVAERLAEVSAEIDKLDPTIKRAAYPIAGVLSCRPVADTGKMSMHGYAAAIDLNLNYSDYWLWNSRSKLIPYKNRMPREIVEIFERHGFIWGGKWYHYDSMHFEYRPELLN